MDLTDQQIERYARHLVLRGIGGPGQRRLRQASVLVLGAGGLGAPILAYLAAAGLGRILVVDDDRVSLANLQRQVLFTTDDVGRLKAEAAADRLTALNPDCDIVPCPERLTAHTAASLLADQDLVLDGCDNFPSRLTLSDAAVAAGVPLISAAIAQFEGQLALFAPHIEGPCYRCFVPEAPHAADTCETVGVLGALAGVVGSLAAAEAVKWLCGLGDPLLGRLMLVDLVSHRSRVIRIPKDPACPACSALPAAPKATMGRTS